MKIKLIDFGLTTGHNPLRVHENDAGADVYMPYDCTIHPTRGNCQNPFGIRINSSGRICRIRISQKQHGRESIDLRTTTG